MLLFCFVSATLLILFFSVFSMSTSSTNNKSWNSSSNNPSRTRKSPPPRRSNFCDVFKPIYIYTYAIMLYYGIVKFQINWILMNISCISFFNSFNNWIKRVDTANNDDSVEPKFHNVLYYVYAIL